MQQIKENNSHYYTNLKLKHKIEIKINIYKEVSHLIGLNCGRVGVTLLHK